MPANTPKFYVVLFVIVTSFSLLLFSSPASAKLVFVGQVPFQFSNQPNSRMTEWADGHQKILFNFFDREAYFVDGKQYSYDDYLKLPAPLNLCIVSLKQDRRTYAERVLPGEIEVVEPENFGGGWVVFHVAPNPLDIEKIRCLKLDENGKGQLPTRSDVVKAFGSYFLVN
jgi:hypothetical protein